MPNEHNRSLLGAVAAPMLGATRTASLKATQALAGKAEAVFQHT